MLQSREEFLQVLNLSSIDVISLRLWLDRKVNKLYWFFSNFNFSLYFPTIKISTWMDSGTNSEARQCLLWCWWLEWMDILWPELNIWWVWRWTGYCLTGWFCKSTILWLSIIFCIIIFIMLIYFVAGLCKAAFTTKRWSDCSESSFMSFHMHKRIEWGYCAAAHCW